MLYSLYIIDSDSARCIFHPLWHCHSCLCCRDIVAIELLWLRDSLIVWMGGLVVKSIQSSEWCFTPHEAGLKTAVIVESIWQSIRVWEDDGRNLLGGAIQPLLTLGVSRSGGGGHHGCGSEHWRGVSMCGLCAILRNLEFFKKIKVPGFWSNFFKLRSRRKAPKFSPQIIFLTLVVPTRSVLRYYSHQIRFLKMVGCYRTHGFPG